MTEMMIANSANMNGGIPPPSSVTTTERDTPVKQEDIVIKTEASDVKIKKEEELDNVMTPAKQLFKQEDYNTPKLAIKKEEEDHHDDDDDEEEEEEEDVLNPQPNPWEIPSTTSSPTTTTNLLTIPPPTCYPPPEEFQELESFISTSISSQHPSSSSSSTTPTTAEDSRKYRALLQLFAKRDDATTIQNILLALRTATTLTASEQGGDSVLHKVICEGDRRIHARLIHYLLRLDPFMPIPHEIGSLYAKLGLEEVEEVATEEKETTKTDKKKKKKKKKKGKEFSKEVLEERQKLYKTQILPYKNFTLADSYLHLVFAMISANSVFVTSVMGSLWNLLVNTGGNRRLRGELRRKWRVLLEIDLDKKDEDGMKKMKKKKEENGVKQGDEEEGQELDQYDVQRAMRLHAALSTILRLCPRGKTDLYPLIASNFPFKLSPLADQIWYAQQCLSVLRYVPTIQGAVLGLLLDKALEIDVEIKVVSGGDVVIDVEEEEEEEGMMEEGMFELEMGDESKHKVKKEEEEEEEVKMKDRKDEVDEMADKLDSLMLLVFQHLSKCCTKNDISAPQRLYKSISPVFDSNILTTHRCKFVQFVILVVCGMDDAISSHHAEIKSEHEINHEEDEEHLDDSLTSLHDEDGHEPQQPKLYREFAAKLINIVLDPYRATVTRQSAACYLASFMSRASYVCPETICESISAMLRWAEAYMETFPSPRVEKVNGMGSPGFVGTPSRRNGMNNMRDQCEMHSLFYTVCQAAFYMMCFRGVEATQYFNTCVEYYSSHEHDPIHDDEDADIPYAHPDDIDISPQRWMNICGHHLDPLKYCLESVRGEFLHLAGIFNLINKELLQELVVEDQKLATGLLKQQQRKTNLISTPATLEKQRMKGGVGGLGRGSNPLDSFFPFDPYLLRRSYPFIEPFYRHWEGSVDVDDLMVHNEEMDEVMMKEEDVSLSGSDTDDDSDSSSDGSDTDDDDSDEEDHAQHMPQTPDAHPMSFNSTCSALAARGEEEGTENGGVKNTQNDVWAMELKRTRTQSIGEECW